MEKTYVTALKRAIELAGSQTLLAKQLGEYLGRSTVSQQTVSYWLNNEVLLEAEWWPAFEFVTAQQVTRHHLRPDVFGNEKAA